MHRSTLALMFLLALGVHSARAQQPTSEQRDPIRAACRSDFIANCAGVEPSGKEALACLMRMRRGPLSLYLCKHLGETLLVICAIDRFCHLTG